MSSINTELFHFSSAALPKQIFYVARFEGTEALNTLYHFKIELLCEDANIDTEALVGTRAVFTIHREEGEDSVFSGYIANITQGNSIKKYSAYTVSLKPALGKFNLIVNSTIFLNCDFKQTIEKIMDQETFFHIEHEFRFSEHYPVKEFAMQYNEKAFDYLLWRLEEQGAYFYFDQTGERVIFADDPSSHEVSQGTLYYSTHSGLDYLHTREIIRNFTLEQFILPQRVIVRNYDWKEPNNIIVGICEVSKNGLGDVYLTDEEVENEDEAKRIAKIRAEQILAARRIFTGNGNVPFLRPGVVFTLSGHHTDKFNRDYLVTKITHEGRQETLLNLLLGLVITDNQEHLYYRNSFKCIESDIKYRSSRTVKRTGIRGAIHAFIDGDNANDPVMDKYGRYKVLFPFDVSGRSGGKASCWLRRAQEQVGKDCGLAFPLLPGTEVLVTFLDGNPDHPIITGALANQETGSISGGGNSSFSGIRTAGGPQLTFDNKHNGVSLTNLSGSGIKFGSGSLDYMQEDTHIQLSSTAVSSSEVAGFFKNNLTGFSTSQAARCDKVSTYIFGILKALGTGAQKELSSLSSNSSDPDKKNSLDWGASATKMGVSLLDSVQQIWNSKHSSAKKYNICITGQKEVAATTIQCFPSTGKIVANILLLLLLRGISAGTESADTKNNADDSDKAGNKDINAFKNTLLQCMQAVFNCKEVGTYDKYSPDSEYYKGAMSSPCAYYAKTSNALSFTIKKLEIKLAENDNSEENNSDWVKKKAELTELSLSLDSLYADACEGTQSVKEYHDFEKKKAVRNTIEGQISSCLPELTTIILTIMWANKLKKANIGGVLIDAQDKNLNLHAKSYIGEHAERGIYLNTVNAASDNSGDWGSPSIKLPGAMDEKIANIFENINSETIPSKASTVEDLIKAGHVNSKPAGWGNQATIPDTNGDTFIAGQTHLYYMQSTASFQYASDKWVSIAPILMMKTAGENAKAMLSLNNDAVICNAEHFISFESRDNENGMKMELTPSSFCYGLISPEDNEKFHGMSGSKEMVRLMHSQDDDPAALVLSKGKAQLSACQNNAAAVSLSKEGVEIKGKQIVLNGEVSLGKVTGAQDGKFEIGGAVKITGLKALNDKIFDDVNDNIKKVDQKVEDELKKLEKEITELKKKLNG